MSHRSKLLVSCLVVTCLTVVSACGASTSKVEKAVPTTAAKAGGQTETTDAPTTTEAESHASSDPDARAYVDAMTRSMMSDPSTPITESQARCFAGRSIDVIGVDRLKAKNITPEDLADDSSSDSSDDSSLDLSDVGLTMADGNRIYDAFGACDIDLQKLMTDSMETGDTEITPEVQACLGQVLTDDNLRAIMVTTIVKGDDAIENDPSLKKITGGMIGCMFMSMGSSTTTP